MANRRKYKIVSVFLLAVFSLNTIVGFACAVGIDMGFNSKHHHDEEATDQTTHHHKSGDKKHNCCNDEVAQLLQIDKSVPQSLNIIHPIFLIAFFDTFNNISLPSFDIVKDIKQFVRSYHPPISNIRIAIQSFQI
jgi:hypothetical protein